MSAPTRRMRAQRPESPLPSSSWRPVRAVTGTLTAGVVVLTLLVVGAAVLASQRSVPGPGAAAVLAHVLASIVAAAAQVASDRSSRGAARMVGPAVIVVTTFALLWTQWWA